METNVCSRCHRHLSDPTSVAVGMGPTCRAKAGAAGRDGPRRGTEHLDASFDVVRVDDGMVWIRDVGVDCRSVTNDADGVVARLAAEYGDRRIIYRDSLGLWDELLHDGPRFLGFAPARGLAPDRVPS